MFISNLNCSYTPPQKSNKPLSFMTISPRGQFEVRSGSFFDYTDSKKAQSPNKFDPNKYRTTFSREMDSNRNNSYFSNTNNQKNRSNFKRRFDFDDSDSSSDFFLQDGLKSNKANELSENDDYYSDDKDYYGDDRKQRKTNQYFSYSYSEEDYEEDEAETRNSSRESNGSKSSSSGKRKINGKETRGPQIDSDSEKLTKRNGEEESQSESSISSSKKKKNSRKQKSPEAEEDEEERRSTKQDSDSGKLIKSNSKDESQSES